MSRRVLHVLAQRPGRTGSGTTLDAVVREASSRGWEQHAVVGVPMDDEPVVGDLPRERIRPLFFGGADLPFFVPGMSDVMPYPSSRFRDLDAGQLQRYLQAWRAHLTKVVREVRPDVIHTHHVWLVSSLLADVAPRVPCVVHVHSTGLRQMHRLPGLAELVRSGCARHARFAVLHQGQVAEVVDALGVRTEDVVVVGAGYREEVFGRGSDGRSREGILFVGKLSAAKGLPWLLDAFESVARVHPDVRLHVVGDGHGSEGEALRGRIRAMAPRVVHHGVVETAALVERMRASSVCVLPSFQEGLPLVLVEAAACGCRLVATALEPITRVLAPAFGSGMHVVPMPMLAAPDRPHDSAVAGFVAALAEALTAALRSGPYEPAPATLETFTWRAVFARVERIWDALSRETAS